MNFDLMEKRYRELVSQRQAGLLDSKQFEDLVAGLRLQDAQQRWWQIDPTSGHWLTWDGSNWQPGTPAASGLPSSGDAALQQAVAFVQSLWRRFLARLISPAEFLRQGRLPMAQRSQGWWDVASIAGGALSGYVWFLYSSIRGMPHFKLLGMSGGRDVWYDFLPSLLLAAIPLLLFAYRGRILARLDRVWTRTSASASYAMQLGAGVIVLAVVLNYFSPALFGWAFAFREGLDFTTPLLMVGIPVLLAIFRSETDQLLQPLQPVRQSLPKFLLIGIVLALPYAIALVLYRVGFNQYELLHWNLALGTLIPYALLRRPAPGGHGPGGAGVAALYWMLPATLILYAGFPVEAFADDCVRDLFNLRDCLRTGVYAEILSGTATTLVSVLINGPELVRILIIAPTGPVPPDVPPTPPTQPEDIEWTAPDGRHNTLTWDAAKGGYINILTGGFVAPQDVEKWKQNIGQTIAQTDEWRARNAELATAAALEAQRKAQVAKVPVVPVVLTAEQRSARQAEIDRILASGQTSLGEYFKNFWTGVNHDRKTLGEDLASAGAWTRDQVVSVGKDVADAMKDMYRDPKIFTDTVTSTARDIKDGITVIGETTYDVGKDLVTHPIDIGYETVRTTVIDARKLASDAAADTRDMITDPTRRDHFIKNTLGVTQIVNSWDPNSRLSVRLANVGIAVFKINSLATTAVAGTVRAVATKAVVSVATNKAAEEIGKAHATYQKYKPLIDACGSGKSLDIDKVKVIAKLIG